MQGIKHRFSVATSISAAVLLACSVVACDRFQSVDSLIADAKQYHQKGDDTSAQIQLKNALQKNPDNVEARNLLGTIYLADGDPQSAEKELRKTLSLGMGVDKVAPLLGQALLMQGQFQKVLDETDKISSQDNVLALRGNAYLGLGKLPEAKQVFEASLKNDPDGAVPLVGLAKTALANKDRATASSLVAQAVEKHPQDVQALLFQAGLLRESGAVDPAMAAFQRVLTLKSNNVEARLNKADLEIRAKQFDAAKTDIDAAAKAAPKHLIVQYMQAVLDFSQGKNAEALVDIQKVTQAAPDYMPGILMSGAVQYAVGDMKQAESYLTKYLDRNPGDTYTRKLLTATYLKTGQIAKASDTLAPALKAAPEDIDLLGLAGEISMQNKDYVQAAGYFAKASVKEPQSARFHIALGVSNLGMGQNATAVSELQTANDLDTTSPRAGILLIMTQLRLKEFDKALAMANALEATQPNNPLVQDLKGGIYLGKEDFPKARAAFEKALAIQSSYFPAVANLAALDMREKKPEVAKQRFEAMLAKDKKSLDALNALANLAVSQNRPEEAATWLEKAHAENPDSLPASIRLASFYLKVGQKQKALTLARKLQVANPTDAPTLDLLAQIQFANDDKEGALASYQRLSTLLPDSAQVQLKIASVQIAMKNIGAASDSIKRALQRQPGNPDAEILQASLYAGSGDTASAIAVTKQIQKQPGHAAMGFELEGNFQTFTKKPDLAAKAYAQAFDLEQQNPRLLMKLLGALNQSGNSQEFDARASQWMQAHPADNGIHVFTADIYLAQKKNKAAIEQYQLALKQEPKNAGVLNNLAFAYQEDKDPRALPTAEKAAQLAPDNAAVQDTLGWMLVQQGNIVRGLPLLQKASATAPQALDIRYHLVQALAKSGDKAKARKELEQLLATGKLFAQSSEAKALLGTL